MIGIKRALFKDLGDFFYLFLLQGMFMAYGRALRRAFICFEGVVVILKLGMPLCLGKSTKFDIPTGMGHTGNASNYDHVPDLFREFKSPFGHILGLLEISRF